MVAVLHFRGYDTFVHIMESESSCLGNKRSESEILANTLKETVSIGMEKNIGDMTEALN